MDELLQRISSLSGQEYGLLEVLVRSGFLSREQLSRWVQQVVDDRLALAETDPSRTQDSMRKLVIYYKSLSVGKPFLALIILVTMLVVRFYTKFNGEMWKLTKG